MIPLETQIFRLIFPPSGSIPLEKIEAVPLIRQHIDSIIDLASTEHGISSPGESAALTARVIELRDTPGPDGKIRTWRTIAEICGTTLDAVRHRYGKGKATIRKSRTVQGLPPVGAPWYSDIAKEWDLGPTGYPTKDEIPHASSMAFNERVPLVGHVEPFIADMVVSESRQTDHPPKTETESLQEAEPINPEKPPEQEQKPDEVATIRDSRTVDATPENLEKLRSDMEAKKAESPDTETLIEVDATLNLKTLAEVDRMLGEGTTVKEISAELEKNKKHVPWTSIRARAAYLAKMKRKEAKPESQEVGATDARPEPVSMSRKELDLRIWDMWRAGKTLEEISEILYSEGLYYSAKSVRVRLLSQGAKL